MRTPYRREQSGFSYLWTLLLVAAVGAGLTVAAEVYLTSVKRDREKELLFIGRQFRAAIGRYYEASPVGKKQYPETLEALAKDPRVPGVRRYLRKIYRDPMTGKPEWGVIRVGGGIAGVYSLATEKPIKIGNFEPVEAEFAGSEKYSDWVFTYPPQLLLQAVKASASSGNVEPKNGVPTERERNLDMENKQ